MSAGNDRVLHALRASSKALTLDNNHLTELPPAIVRLSSLRTLSAKNNQLSEETVMNVFDKLPHLSSINLGGNLLSRLPLQYTSSCCDSITSLHLFDNRITTLDENVIKQLVMLKMLNLNNNFLQSIPPSIGELSNLSVISLSYNKIHELTSEICKLDQLTELHCDNNSIDKIPNGIGNLRKLKKLFLQKNEIQNIPSSIGKCVALRTLDVSCNRIQIFPNEIRQLSLEEFYFEHNPLIPPIPLPSDQINEILPLQEIACRFLVTELINDGGLDRMVQTVPIVNELLSKGGICCVCNGPFFNSWLDCVEYVQSKKIFNLSHQGHILPLSITLCSYACFNKEHYYYGIALLSDKNIQ